MSDLIYRQDAVDAIKKNTFRLTVAEEQNCEGHVAWSAEAVYSDVMEGALLELPPAQPEIIRCKDCKWCEDADGLMCKNTASWVVATDYDFGCVLAERRQDG